MLVPQIKIFGQKVLHVETTSWHRSASTDSLAASTPGSATPILTPCADATGGGVSAPSTPLVPFAVTPDPRARARGRGAGETAHLATPKHHIQSLSEMATPTSESPGAAAADDANSDDTGKPEMLRDIRPVYKLEPHGKFCYEVFGDRLLEKALKQ